MKTTRIAGISSTATGYNFRRMTLGGHTGNKIAKERKNITAASMRRFYRFSQHDMSIVVDREITWERYWNLFCRRSA